MAKKPLRRSFTDDYKAQIVARVLKAQETGEETVYSIADAEKLGHSMLYTWVKKAKETNGVAAKASAKAVAAEPGKRKPSDLKSLSRELAEAMGRVSVIKKRMRKLLSED